MIEPLISEGRIAELIAEYPTHSDKWLLCAAVMRETAAAIVKMLEAVALTGPLDEEQVLWRAIKMIRRGVKPL